MFRGKEKAADNNLGIVPGFEAAAPMAGQLPGYGVARIRRGLIENPDGTVTPFEHHYDTGETYELSHEAEADSLVNDYGHDPRILNPVAPVDTERISGKISWDPNGGMSFEGELPAHHWPELVRGGALISARNSGAGTSPGYVPGAPQQEQYYGPTMHDQVYDQAYGTQPTYGVADEGYANPDATEQDIASPQPLTLSLRGLREFSKRYPIASKPLWYGAVAMLTFNALSGRWSVKHPVDNIGYTISAPFAFVPVAKNAGNRVYYIGKTAYDVEEALRHGAGKVLGVIS